MQSYRSQQALAGFFRNPTILAMIGSAGIHGVFVLFTALKPAESLPAAPLRVISLDPGSGTPNLNGLLSSNGLPVPNGLPPINLGDVPTYLGSGSPTVDLSSLSDRNPPQKSAAGAQDSVVKRKVPKTPSKPSTDPTQTLASGNRLSPEKLQEQRDRDRYALRQNPARPNLTPGTLIDPSGASSSSPSTVPNPGFPNPTAPTGDSAAPARDKLNAWLQTKSQVYKQPISNQSDLQLTAAYPQSACNTRVSGSALVTGLFGPDGAIAPGSDSVQVLQSAETWALTQSAMSTVEGYRVPVPSGIYQALSFKVDIPYSEAACTAQGSPKTPVEPSPSSTDKVVPKSGATPSPAARKATSKEEFLKQLESGNQPIGTPPSPSSQRQQPTPSIAGTQNPEPLPTPSIAVPEGAPKSP